MPLPLRFRAEHVQTATDFAQRLAARGVVTLACEVAEINSRLLRLHPELSLAVDANGLWLCANGMKMQPDWTAEIPRLKRASLKSELIARACQLAEAPELIDATAGLGHDSLLMAALGAQVQLIERHPILYTLLEDALARAQTDHYLAPIAARMRLIYNDASTYLGQMSTTQLQADVVYLDPMFPQRDQHGNVTKKQAQVKKQMQLLHVLLPDQGAMDLGDALLPLAQQVAKRVVVKRPKHAVFLNAQMPDHQWLGDACRFDAYFALRETAH